MQDRNVFLVVSLATVAVGAALFLGLDHLHEQGQKRSKEALAAWEAREKARQEERQKTERWCVIQTGKWFQAGAYNGAYGPCRTYGKTVFCGTFVALPATCKEVMESRRTAEEVHKR